MPSPSHLNVQLPDGSVRAIGSPQPVTPWALCRSLLRAGSHIRVTAFGVMGPALGAALTALRRAGLPAAAPQLQAPIARWPLLMVAADSGRAPGASTLFVATDGSTPIPLLLPAVQAAREAARRASQGGPIGLVLVQGQAGAQALPAEGLALNFEHIYI